MIIDRTDKPKKILVGGVPFGRDNVGDEAILESVVLIVRAICPGAEIWVSTDDREATEKKLNVMTVPLFGFDPPGFCTAELLSTIEAVDVFIWSGATGLSDYPEIPLHILQQAANKEKKTVILCTGMNTELNPSLYKLMPGLRHKFFSVVRALSFSLVDLIERYEENKRRHTAKMMKKELNQLGWSSCVMQRVWIRYEILSVSQVLQY